MAALESFCNSALLIFDPLHLQSEVIIAAPSLGYLSRYLNVYIPLLLTAKRFFIHFEISRWYVSNVNVHKNPTLSASYYWQNCHHPFVVDVNSVLFLNKLLMWHATSKDILLFQRHSCSLVQKWWFLVKSHVKKNNII